MDRDTILERLNDQSAALKQRYGLRSLAVFGSMARGDDHQGSDVDILATFEGPATFDRYMGLKLDLGGTARPPRRSGDARDTAAGNPGQG